MIELIPFLLLALILGFKHSYDADHILVVSNILKKIKSVKNALKVGFSWAIGHVITASIVTILLFYFKNSILDFVLPHMEKIVGLMLIVLGLWSIKEFFQFHSHEHKHGSLIHSHFHIHFQENHEHKHMLGLGIIQGLASNDELLILFTASLGVTSIGGILLGVGFFSIGVVVGMLLFCAVFAIPLIKLNGNKINKYMSFGIGSVSIAYGALTLTSVI